MAGETAGSGRGVTMRGSTLQVVQTLAAQGEPERAAQLYEELGAAQRERLRKEASQGTAKERHWLVDVLRRARDFTGAARLL
ncbi:MAG: cyclic nucleotide-binding domain-containing protein, partial [Myxococcaceae bacterium]